jgi:hypothetical protein
LTKPEEEPHQILKGVQDMSEGILPPTFNPEALLGKIFTTEHAGPTQKAQVMEPINDQTFLVEFADGNEDHLTYAELVNLMNKETEHGHQLWTFT